MDAVLLARGVGFLSVLESLLGLGLELGTGGGALAPTALFGVPLCPALMS